ncbi:large exoprotein [Microbacterium sp. MAHUQ-60]|uniref:large exoprotein n=1 Tax=unclassified Microbacterium TaxID=2609290 RepID=UPI003613A9C0
MDNGDLAGLGALYAMIAVLTALLFIVVPIAYVVGSLFMMKIFEKAGVQGKWRAWVPVYNIMIFFKLGDMSPWLVLYGIGGMIVLSWIPVLGFFGGLIGLALGVLSAMAAWRVGLKLQKEAAWVILYVLVSVVWLGINAFDKSRWNPNVAPSPWAANAFLADRTVWDGVPTQPSAGAVPGSGAPQGYGTPQGYAAPPQGYQPPAQPGYGAPVPPAPGAPAPQAPGAPVPPPATPPAPPTAPPAAPGTPPAPPAAPGTPPPAPPVDPTQPPA